MKFKTKLKIIRFIKKLLRFYESKDIHPFLEIETRRIMSIQSNHMCSEREMLMVSEAQIRFAHGSTILTELEKLGAIVYTQERVPLDAHIRHKAELKIIMPKQDDAG